MSKPNYRVILTYDADRKIFHARAPELEHCAAEGATRAEAIARAEEEIDAQLANMLSHGTTPPRSADEEIFSGEIAAKVSKTLHRDLAYQARTEGIDLDHLIGELLASAMEPRKQVNRGARPSGNRAPTPSHDQEGNGNRYDGPRRQGFGGRGTNHALLDDRANFIEYVRGLEQQGNHAMSHHAGHRGPGGGGPGGGRGGSGPGGGDGRRRRRGGPNNSNNSNFRGGPNPNSGYNGQGQGRGPQGPQGVVGPQSPQPVAAAPAPEAPERGPAGAASSPRNEGEGQGNV